MDPLSRPLKLALFALLLFGLVSPSSALFHDKAGKAIGGIIDKGKEAVSGVQPGVERGISDLQRGAQQVTQALKPLTQSDFRFDFRVDCTSSSVKAKPGESATVTFNCRGGRGSVTVTLLGQTGSASFDTPLGRASIPVTGIESIASLNVDIAGSLEGAVSMSPADAAATPSRITWSSYGPQSVTVRVPQTATPGTRYTVEVLPKYTATVGGSVSALGTSQSIASFTAPVASAPPARATIEVVSPNPLPGFEAAFAVVALLVAASLWQSRKRR